MLLNAGKPSIGLLLGIHGKNLIALLQKGAHGLVAKFAAVVRGPDDGDGFHAGIIPRLHHHGKPRTARVRYSALN